MIIFLWGETDPIDLGEEIEIERTTPTNTKGFHARASALFTEIVWGYQEKSDHLVYVRRVDEIKHLNDFGQFRRGDDIMDLLLLPAPGGVEVEIVVAGKHRKELIGSLVALVENGFGEDY